MFWRALYALATWMALPVVLIYFAWRGRLEPAYRRHWPERLGYPVRRNTRPVWVHAASVGEVVLAAPLIAALQTDPGRSVLVTTMTPTGRAEARRRFGESIDLAYMPLDTPGATRRFVQRVRPVICVLIETELWPHLIAAVANSRCPIALVNATVSPRSARRYQASPAAALIRSLLSRIDWIGSTTAADAARLIEMGAAAARVLTTGNLKYDLILPADLDRQALLLREQWQVGQRPIWVAASTHAGEERALLGVFRSLRMRFPDLLWVLAPRHPQRFSDVADLLMGSEFSVARRSAEAAVSTTTDIVLADTLGEVPLFYRAGDIAFVGGSLVSGIGGHNVIEPAACARVLVVGPHIDEWQAPMALLADAGAVIATDTDEVASVVADWLANEDAREQAGRDNAARVATHRGALAATIDNLRQLIDSPRKSAHINTRQ